MKVFWYQGGLHFEPEVPEDQERLKFLAKQYHVKEPEPCGAPRLAQGSSEAGDDLFSFVSGSGRTSGSA